MTDRYFNSVNFAGDGGGAGFTLGPVQNVFTGSDRAAAEAARDSYAANPANSAWLPQYNSDTSLNIRLEYSDGTDSIATYQVRNESSNAWLDNQSFTAIQGEPGQNGADGLQLEFSSRQKLDEFFIANPDRLVVNLPVVMHIEDNVVTDLVWNGPDNPTDYVVGDLRWRTAASRVSNNSLFVGSTRISNAVEDILVTTGDGSQFLAVGVGFTSSGSERINDIELDAQETLTVNALDDQVLADPFSLGYETFGNNLTTDFEFKPNEAGELRAIYYLGGDDSGPVIFDETRTVTQAEVDTGNFISFGIGNPYMLDQGIQIYVTFSGIQLKGGTVTGGQFDGQTIIAFQSTIQPFTRFPIARMNEVGGQVDSVSGGFLISVDDTNPESPEVSVGFSLGTGLSIDNTDPDNPVLNSTTALPIQDEGLQVSSSPTAINFVGDGVEASDSGGVVSVSISGGGVSPDPNNLGGPIVPFTGDVTVNSGNFDTYIDAIALYVRADNRLTTFNLPSIADIAGRYPATITILHQGGTDRDAGTTFNPSNRVRVPDPDPGGDGLERPSGSALQFFDVRQNDLATFTRTSADTPWIVVSGTLTSGALLLPDGLFNLKPEVVRFPTSLNAITGIPTGFVPQAGDAYEVGQEDLTFGGFGVKVGDVIVALIDNPSRLRSADNDDWLVIRNATNSTITLQELRFLNTITEVDTFTDSRLMDRADVNDVRLFLADGVLDHAPFINPSLDSDNPQASNGASYVGGDEKDGADFEFEDTENHFNALVYLDIDGSFNIATEIESVFVVMKDREGAEVQRLSLNDDFRTITLTGSADTYYVYDNVGAVDNYSSIHYINGYSIDVVHRNTERQFNLGANVNVLPSIADGEIEIAKLEPNAQALLQADHSLTDAQETKLAGLQTTDDPTDWTAGDLYVKLSDDASPSNDLASYHNVGQQNGILGNFDSTTDVTLLVPNFVTVTGLQRTDDTSVKQSVTPIGTILNRQAFTATLPASTFDINNPVGDAWQIDGTASNAYLSGVVDTFKINRPNLSDSLVTWIQSQIPDAPANTQLPDNLQQLASHLTVTNDIASNWTDVTPVPIRADLAREFAALWDENRTSFTGNYFADLTGIEVIGYQGNNIFFYSDPNDRFNTGFPGAQSYIENSNVRIRNLSGQTTISDSFRKIIAFDYALERELFNDENESMLRVGPSASTPLLALAENEGLYLNIGRGDGGQRTRTRDIALSVVGGHWHNLVDEIDVAEAEVIIPQSLTGSLVVKIEMQLDNNGNDAGTHVETITLTNLDADQTIGNRDFTFMLGGSPIDREVGITYQHDNNDLSNSRRVIFLRPTQPFNNAALTYNVAATYPETETWNVATTYARYPVNAGDSHDDFGIFDPHLYNTEHVHERNRIILSVQKYREDDTESDPEMAVRVIVDGESEASGNIIRLHRPASDFTFDDMSFGNNIVAVSHIQEYLYDGTPPSDAELQRLYSHGNEWLGAFYPPGHGVEDVIFDANIELTAGHAIILVDVTTGNRRIIEIDDGTLTNKDA